MFETSKATYKNDSTGKTQRFVELSRFKIREMSIDGRPRIKRPSTVRINENAKKICKIGFED